MLETREPRLRHERIKLWTPQQQQKKKHLFIEVVLISGFCFSVDYSGDIIIVVVFKQRGLEKPGFLLLGRQWGYRNKGRSFWRLYSTILDWCFKEKQQWVNILCGFTLPYWRNCVNSGQMLQTKSMCCSCVLSTWDVSLQFNPWFITDWPLKPDAYY